MSAPRRAVHGSSLGRQISSVAAAIAGLAPSALLVEDTRWMRGMSDSALRMRPPGDFLGFGWVMPWSPLAAMAILSAVTLWKLGRARNQRILACTITLAFVAASIANFIAYRRLEVRLFSALHSSTHSEAWQDLGRPLRGDEAFGDRVGGGRDTPAPYAVGKMATCQLQLPIPRLTLTRGSASCES